MPFKALFILIWVLALVYTAMFWIPLAIILIVVYFIYFVIRAMVVGPSPAGLAQQVNPHAEPMPDPPAAAASIPPPMPLPQRPQRPARRCERVRHERAMAALPVKPPRQILTELLGSLLLSAGVATAMAVVISVILQLLEKLPIEPARLGWLAFVATLGAWGVLIPSKFWEGTRGEPILRRFVLLCVGLGLGFAAFLAEREFFVDLPELMNAPRAMLATEGVSRLAMFLAYFGFLLPILRWWRQAEPLRRSRFSLWSTAVCVFWAGLLGFAWRFPQPWGVLAAATMAISIQLAAPWIDYHRRFVRQVV
jgi:hypothetical protein